MEIDQYHRKQRPIASAGNIIASPSNSYGELGQMGKVITELGIASEQQRLKAQYYDQINSAKLQMARKFEEFQNSLSPEDTDKWLDNLDNMQRSFDGIKLSNERARADFNTILEEEKLRQQKSISDYRRVIDSRNFQQNYYVNYKQNMEIASRQSSPGEFDDYVLKHLSSQYGLRLKEGAKEISADNLEAVENFDNPLFHTEELRKNEARAWLDDTNKLYDQEQLKKHLNIALNLSDGLAYIDSLGLDTEDKRKLVSDYNFEKNIKEYRQKEALDTRGSEVLSKAQDLAAAGKFEDGREVLFAARDELGAEWFDDVMPKYNRAIDFFTKKNVNSFTNRQDEKAYWSMFNKVRDYPDSVTDKELRDGVGIKWTINDYKELYKLKYDDEDPLKGPIAKMYLDSFETLVWPKDEKRTADQALYYSKGMSYLRDLLRDPNISLEEVNERYKQLIEPYVKDWWGKNWGKLIKGLPGVEGPAKGGENENISERLLNIEPNERSGFEFEIKRISSSNPELAKKYFEKYKHKWPEVY